jgi:hypothetical protein
MYYLQNRILKGFHQEAWNIRNIRDALLDRELFISPSFVKENRLHLFCFFSLFHLLGSIYCSESPFCIGPFFLRYFIYCFDNLWNLIMALTLCFSFYLEFEILTLIFWLTEVVFQTCPITPSSSFIFLFLEFFQFNLKCITSSSFPPHINHSLSNTESIS